MDMSTSLLQIPMEKHFQHQMMTNYWGYWN